MFVALAAGSSALLIQEASSSALTSTLLHSCTSNPSPAHTRGVSVSTEVPARPESTAGATGSIAERAVYVENIYNSDGGPQLPFSLSSATGWKASCDASCEPRRVVIERAPNEQIGIQIASAPAPAIASADSDSSDSCCCNVGGGVFVAQVLAGSLAEREGLRRGDQLLEVCGINLRNAEHAAALQILRQCTETVELLVQYNPGKLLAAEQTAAMHNSPLVAGARARGQSRSRSNSCFEQPLLVPVSVLNAAPDHLEYPSASPAADQRYFPGPQQPHTSTEQTHNHNVSNGASPPPLPLRPIDSCNGAPAAASASSSWRPTSRAVLCRSGSSRSVRSMQRSRLQQHRDSVVSAHTRILEDSSESNDAPVSLFANHVFRKLTN